jgi:catechol 2,3-dioxygenase-like lactoylglutathione lyase family enzyme
MPPGGGGQAREFYAGILGLAEIARPALLNEMDLVWFDLEQGRQLHCFAISDVQPQPEAHFALGSMDYDALLGRLVEAGLNPKADESWLGQRRCFIRDPFGNLVEVLDAATLSWNV